MKKIVILHLDSRDEVEAVRLLGQQVEIKHVGCQGDLDKARGLIALYDGEVDGIGLDGFPAELRLGTAVSPHTLGQTLHTIAQTTPVVDGSGIRTAVERWGITLIEKTEPGLFNNKRILMVPGLNHTGLAQTLGRRTSHMRYADPNIYFALPNFPGVGGKRTLDQMAGPTLNRLKDAPFQRIMPPAGFPKTPRYTESFEWADVLAGDIGSIRRYAPMRLDHKIIVVPSATEADAKNLQQRGASILITIMPTLNPKETVGRWSTATIEALLVALAAKSGQAVTEDTYLNLMAEMDWAPTVQYLQPGEGHINRFAFVIHPLHIGFVHNHPWFGWTRYFPDSIVEAVAAYIPPLYLSRIKGGQSPTTGQKIEGVLYTLGATPRKMMAHRPRFTYSRLKLAAKMAEDRGARLMGLGAFTSVVGDAGVTVAHETNIAITSGNSLTVAATLEAAKQAMVKMGATDLTQGKAMVIGATGSIGSVCARLLAQAISDVVLVSIEPERLIELKQLIEAETPGAKVAIATKTGEWLPQCDLIITATSAFGQRILDITQCKPGAVICDVARPADINPAEADLRPDVLVIESGEVLIPGDINFGYDIGLPSKTAYACLAETALLAMEGRFENYTLGRNIKPEKVKEIYRLFKKHQFKIAKLRSFDAFLTEERLANKRKLATQYRNDLVLFARVQAEAEAALAKMPMMAKGIVGNGSGKGGNGRFPTSASILPAFAAGVGMLTWWFVQRRRK